MFSSCLSVDAYIRACMRLANKIFDKALWDLTKFIALVHFGTKTNQMDFEAKKVKDQGHDQTKYYQKTTSVAIFSQQNTK